MEDSPSAEGTTATITPLDEQQQQVPTPPTVLDSISSEFKGILMDIHSSMMAEDGDASNGENFDSSVAPDFAKDDQDQSNGMNTNEKEQIQDVEMTEDKLPEKVGGNTDFTQIAGLDDNYTSFGGGSEELMKSATENVDFVEQPEPPPPVTEKEEEEQHPPLSKIKLYVSNLPTGFSSEDITNLFQPFGNVIECEMFPYKNFANVYLDSEAGGFEAIKELNKVKINGTQITVMKSAVMSKDNSVNCTTEEVGTFKLYIPFIHHGVTKEFVQKMVEEYGRVVEIEIYRMNSAFVHMEEEAAGRKVIEALNGKLLPECNGPLQVSESKHPEGPSLATVKLQVKNFPENLTADQMRSLFQPYGLVLRCSLSKSKFDLLRKAVVHLEQLGDIRSAIKELSELELNGKKLIVEPLVEPKQPKEPIPPPVLTKKGKKLTMQSGGLPPLQLKPEYGYEEFSDGYEDYNYPNPGSSMYYQRGRGRGGRMRATVPPRPFQLIPMPSATDHMPPRGRGRGMRPSFGVRGGYGRGLGHEGFVPRIPKRTYQPYQEFVEDYGFDEYYQDSSAAVARDHYASLSEEYEQYNQQIQASQFSYCPPPQKKSRGRGGRGGGFGGGGGIPSLMPQNFNPYAEDTSDYETQTAYQPHGKSFPSLNLPLGEREYFGGKKKKKGNNKGGNHQQMQQQVQNFQQQQHMIASGYQSSYLVPEQIPGTSAGFEYDTAYPADYYQGADNFSAVPFDYNNLKQKQKWNRQNQSNVSNGTIQTKFPEGVNPADYAHLKPGARVYKNHAGKVMVRGVRGGQQNKNKKARKPGLGSGVGGLKVDAAASGNGAPITGANQVQVGTSAATANKFANFSKAWGAGQGGPKRYKTKDELKNENQEYTDWLQSKAWLTQAIPGVVRPAT